MENSSLKGLLPEPPPREFYRILIADDEPVARHLLGAVLKAAGYTNLEEVEDGAAALKRLAVEDIHLVLLDKNMPGADGLEVLRKGRTMRSACEFIVITAYGSLESAIEAIDLGAYSYIKKPFAEADVVIRRVTGALERVQMRLENEMLLDKLRLVLAELEEKAAGGQPRTQQFGEVTGVRPRVDEALKRVKMLSERMIGLRQRARGSAVQVFDKLEREMAGVASLLGEDDQKKPGDDG